MSEHITHPAAVQRLERSTSDRKLAGVAGGLGRYFDLNPSFFRIGFVVLTLLGGAGLLIYLVAAFVMPDEGKEKSLAEQILADRREPPVAARRARGRRASRSSSSSRTPPSGPPPAPAGSSSCSPGSPFSGRAGRTGGPAGSCGRSSR